MKKLLSFICVLAILLTLLTACNKETSQGETSDTAEQGTTSSTAVTSPEDDSVQEWDLTWYIDLSWWKWNGLEWGQDLVSREIKEKTGVNIKFIIPAADDSQQLSSMIASDSLPDVITVDGWWSQEKRALTGKLAEEGYLVPLNGLIKRPEVIREDVMKWFEESDGNTYLVSNYAYGAKDIKQGEHIDPNGCFTVRKDLWEQIGSPDMSTPEAFLDACQRVKDEIGTYNGQQIIPIMMYEGVGNTALWMSQYFATPFEDENGDYLYDFLQPNYKEALKFLNTAYNRGLIGEANFSDNRDLINEKLASGRVFAQLTAPQDMVVPMQSLYELDNNAVYVPFKLSNSAGDDPVLQDLRGMGWLTTGITKTAKDPQKIFELFEFLMSDEGQILCAYGVEGETFQYNAEGKIEIIPSVQEEINKGDGAKYALGAAMMLDNWAFRRNVEAPSTDPKVLATVEYYIKPPMAKYAYDFTAKDLRIDPSDPRTPSMNEMGAKIRLLRDENIAKIVAAKNESEFNTLYDETIADMKVLGLDEYLVFCNDMYHNAKDALGIEFAWPLNIK